MNTRITYLLDNLHVLQVFYYITVIMWIEYWFTEETSIKMSCFSSSLFSNHKHVEKTMGTDSSCPWNVFLQESFVFTEIKQLNECCFWYEKAQSLISAVTLKQPHCSIFTVVDNDVERLLNQPTSMFLKFAHEAEWFTELSQKRGFIIIVGYNHGRRTVIQ